MIRISLAVAVPMHCRTYPRASAAEPLDLGSTGGLLGLVVGFWRWGKSQLQLLLINVMVLLGPDKINHMRYLHKSEPLKW